MARERRRDVARFDDEVLRRFAAGPLARLVETYAPQRVIAFGSRARGDALKHSDLDLVIVARAFEDQPWLERATSVLRLIGPIGVGVEPLCYTPAEFERKRRELGIVRAAVTEGIEMLEVP